MAWHDCKLWISALFCLHSEVFHWSRFRWVRFAHSKEECPKPRYYLLFGCTEGAFWGEIFFKVLEFLSLIHCFVRLDIDFWKFFEDMAIGMIFCLNYIFERCKCISSIWECFSCDQYLPRRRTDALFSVAAELKSVLMFLFTACHPRNRLFRRFLVFFQVIWSVNCRILLIFLSWDNGI